MSVFYDEGLYVGEVLEQALGKTSTGKPQAVIRVRVLGTPINETTHEKVKQQYERTIYMVLTDKTMPFTIENLRVAGFDGDRITQFDPSHADHVSIVGNQIRLWCKHEEDQNGTLRERWQISKGQSALEVKPLAAKEMRELDSLFAKSLKAAPKAAAPPKREANKPNIHDVYITDDDLPPMDDPNDPGIEDQDIPF